MKDEEKMRAGKGSASGAGRVLRIVLIVLALAAAAAACGYALWHSGWLERLGSVEELRELIARRLGRRAVQRIVDNSVMEKYLPVSEEKQDTFLFLTLLFPFFPDDIICILAGLTSISLRRFVCIMALARPWGLVFAALLGSGAFTMPTWAWGALGVPMLGIFVVAMRYGDRIESWLFEKFRKISGRKR